MSRRRKQPGGTFLAIPEEVFRSRAFISLPSWARDVLWLLIGEYRGKNNGKLFVTVQQCRAYGVSRRKRSYALRLLVVFGLIERTTTFYFGAGAPDHVRYALTFREVNEFLRPVIAGKPPSNRWKEDIGEVPELRSERQVERFLKIRERVRGPDQPFQIA